MIKISQRLQQRSFGIRIHPVPVKAFAFFATMEWEIQQARLMSALAAYREMRQETDAAQTCQRVLRMLNATTPVDYEERWNPW